MSRASLLKKVAIAIRNEDCCGAIYAGEHVFCDDERLERPHGSCPCKKLAEAAALVVLEELNCADLGDRFSAIFEAYKNGEAG